MNEFELRRQLRSLRKDAEPPAQVWTNILESVIGAPETPTHAAITSPAPWHKVHWQALAATLLVASLAMALRMSPVPQPPAVTRHVGAPVSPPTNVAFVVDKAHLSVVAELARNPILAGTDAELRELQEQLHAALALEPASAKLRRMLARTEIERRRLLMYQSQLG